MQLKKLCTKKKEQKILRGSFCTEKEWAQWTLVSPRPSWAFLSLDEPFEPQWAQLISFSVQDETQNFWGSIELTGAYRDWKGLIRAHCDLQKRLIISLCPAKGLIKNINELHAPRNSSIDSLWWNSASASILLHMLFHYFNDILAGRDSDMIYIHFCE